MVSALLMLFYLAILITVAIIIINTNSTSKALAYLLLIFIVPVVGVIVYFAIGRNYRINKMYSKKLQVDNAAFPEIETKIKEYSTHTTENLKHRLKHFLKLTQIEDISSVLTTNNNVDLLINGEEKFPDIIKALQQAKHFIHIEYYIYEDDSIGTQIGEVLKQKAREGVEVRFIYDDLGSKSIRKSFVKNLIANGVEAFPFYKIKWLFFANRLNYRNHRKIIVIDGNIGYVGGINISERYTNPNNHNLYWRDTHLKVTGAAVLSLQRIFLSDWNFCANQNIGVTKNYFPVDAIFKNNKTQLAQIIYSGPDSDYPSIMYAMIQAILLSKQEILITTPYFVPNDSFMNALKIACLSNVDVKILVPGVSDNVFVNATSNSYYQELLEVGAKVYKYQKGFVHAKTMVCDGLVATVGTANLDQRSFELNFEVNAFIYDENFSEKLRANFFDDLENAEELFIESWKNRPLPLKLFERTVRLVSPLM